ncbi:MAG: tetratricopeptide repeat protein [Opitutaceae bacterium]
MLGLRIYLLSFCCLLATVLHTAAQTSDRVEFYYGMAEGNYLVGNLDGATSGIQQTLRIAPDHVPALTLQARVLLDQGKSEMALQSAERAIELEPHNLEHKLLKALVLEKMQGSEEAVALIKSVIEKAPAASDDFRAANQLLGLLQMADGNWDAAAESFNQIYLADPSTASTSLKLSSEAYLEKARLALESASKDDAIQAIDQAISVYQGKTGQEALQERTKLQLMRARLLAQLGQSDQAIRDLQQVVAQQPNHLEATITLASLCASAERWETLDELIPTLAKVPELTDITLYFEGRSAYSKGRVGTAREKFEEAIDLKHESQLTPALHFHRGLCLRALNRNEDAKTEIIKALNLGFLPESTEESLAASQILIHSKQAERAIPILEALTLNKVAPTAETWALLGHAHQIENTPTLAISAYNEAIAIDPNQADTRAARGALLRTIGDLEGAVADYKIARNLDPENSAYAYALGLVELQLGQLNAAEQHFRFASEKLPKNTDILLLHSLLAYTTNHIPEAAKSLDNYFAQKGDKPNETAIFLEYAIKVRTGTGRATLGFYHRLNGAEPSEFLKKFMSYNAGKLDRKAIIDHAGIAATPELAQRQICEAAFWIAQHEYALGNIEAHQELLQLISDIGNPDIPEYQLARWQLKVPLQK